MNNEIDRNAKKIVIAGIFSILLLSSFGILNSHVFGQLVPASPSVSVGSTSISNSTSVSVGNTTVSTGVNTTGTTASTPSVTTSGNASILSGNTTISTGAILSSQNVTNTLNATKPVSIQGINQTSKTAASNVTAAQNIASTIAAARQAAASEADQVIANAQQKISYGQNTLASAEQQLQSAQNMLSASTPSAANVADQAVGTATQEIAGAQQALAAADMHIQSAQNILSSNAPSAASAADQTATNNAQQALLVAQNQISNIQTTLSSAITVSKQDLSATLGTWSLEFPATTANTATPSTTTLVNPTAVVPLPAPTGLAAVAVSPYQINLSWNAPSVTGLLVSGYEIERSSDGGNSWSTIASNTGSASTVYSDTGLAASTTYYYRVSAIYPAGTSSPSNTASATTLSTTYALSVTSQLTTGGPLTGLYAYLMQNGKVVQTGFTPVTFFLNNTLTYSVGIDNFPPYAFDYWKDTGSTANPRTISISSNTQVTGIFQDTDLILSPSKGPTGTVVSVTGTSFAANKTITMTWDGTPLSTTPSVVTTNSAGGFNATFQVPSAASSGSHTVQATDGISTHSTIFTVSAPSAISLNTSSVNVGSDIRVAGTNFPPNYMITLSFDGTPIGVGAQDVDSGSTSPSTITTDSNGNFVAVMQMLRSVAGTHTISAKDSVNDLASQTVTVLPHVFVFPTAAKPGSTVLIPASQGNGFAANSTISIKFDGSSLAPTSSMTTDSKGNFGGGFVIPSTATTGSHIVTISDGQGNTYTIPSFTVDPNAHSFSAQVVASGFAPSCTFWAGCTDVPDYFAFIPDGNLTQQSSGTVMVNEKNSGNVLVLKYSNGQFVKQSVPFVKVPNLQVAYETNGLLGIALDPNWANTLNPEKWVYLYVTRNQTVNGVTTGNIVGQLIRYQATTDSSGDIVADQTVGEQVVLGNIPAFYNGHNGGGIKFDSQGNLIVSTGDGWQFDAVSQNLASYQGKILRITPVYGSQVNGEWYTIPSSNPFASSTNPVTQTIWTTGERNPYAFDVDSATGKIYVSDTGFNTWEAIINATTAGSNGGWSDYERPPVGNPANLQNYMPSIYWYPHQGVEPLTGPSKALEALSAGAFYHGTTYPGLDGAYFYGDYGVGKIEALLPQNTAMPTTDPVSGVQKSQVMPILYGLTLGPVHMEEWNGKLYFFDLTGNLNVLNYN